MKLSSYNMQVVEQGYRGLKGTGVKFKVLKEIDNNTMIWSITKGEKQRLATIHNGIVVANIEA